MVECALMEQFSEFMITVLMYVQGDACMHCKCRGETDTPIPMCIYILDTHEMTNVGSWDAWNSVVWGGCCVNLSSKEMFEEV